MFLRISYALAHSKNFYRFRRKTCLLANRKSWKKKRIKSIGFFIRLTVFSTSLSFFETTSNVLLRFLGILRCASARLFLSSKHLWQVDTFLVALFKERRSSAPDRSETYDVGRHCTRGFCPSGVFTRNPHMKSSVDAVVYCLCMNAEHEKEVGTWLFYFVLFKTQGLLFVGQKLPFVQWDRPEWCRRSSSELFVVFPDISDTLRKQDRATRCVLQAQFDNFHCTLELLRLQTIHHTC